MEAVLVTPRELCPMSAGDELLSMKLGVLHEDVGEIKSAIGKLSDAVTKLALVEERQMHANASLERAFAMIERIENRLIAVERSLPSSTRTTDWVDRAVLGVVALIFLYVAKIAGLL